MSNVSPQQDFETDKDRAIEADRLNGSDILDYSITEINSQSQSNKISNWWQKTQQFWSNQTLRNRLSWVVLPTALLPLFIASSVNYHVSLQRSKEHTTEKLKDRVLIASKATNKLVEEALETPRTLVFNPLVIEAIQNYERTGAVQDTRTVDNFKLNSYLQKLADVEEIEEIYITASDGRIVAYTHAPNIYLQGEREWWRASKAGGEWISYSSEAEEKRTAAFTLEFGVKIEDPDTSQFIGAIKAIIPFENLDPLSQYLENTGISGTQKLQIFYVGQDNLKIITTIDSSSKENKTTAIIGSQEIENIAKTTIDQLNRQRKDDRAIKQQLSEDFKNIRQLEVYPFRYANNDETTEIISFIYQRKRYTIAVIPQTNWVTVASIDLKDINAAANTSIWIFVTVGIIVALGSAIALLFLARQISAPLGKLAIAAEKVATGNLEVEAETSGTQETQTLARSFNNLLIQVRSLLEKQTEEAKRTKILAELSRARDEREIESALNKLLIEARQTLQADRTIIYKFDANWQGAIVAESVAAEFPRSLGNRMYDPCFAEKYVDKYREGRTVAIADIYEAGLTDCHLKQLEPLQVKANLVVPIVIGDRLYGLLIAHQCSSTRQWQTSEIDYLAQLAAQIGLSLSSYTLLEQKQTEAERERQQKEAMQTELLQLLNDVEGASQGDLTVRAEISASEIGIVADFFNAIIENLRDIVTKVKKAATQVNSSIGENEIAIRELADEALQQATQIAETLNSVENMAKSIQKVADNAEAAARVAKTASSSAQSGERAMERTVETILQMRETVSETAKKVKRLGESSQQISKVISLIDQIAMQTNLLAINAGIEAARAGEEGRGFAVVAEEVGELAEQSAAATKEIQQIVENIQQETAEVADAMEVGTAQVVEGTRLVEKTKKSLAQIVQVSRQIDELVESISKATVSQAKTSQSVTNLIQEISRVSQRSSQSSRQVSSSLQETVEIAKQLQSSVSTFVVEEET
ncbi:MAG: methyl-accepting chemotaxis protein [Prochloraceae cyanobacterium]|nr:methyl-accepting chemotaxis protein [Prochloraceae cyanobacterium]